MVLSIQIGLLKIPVMPVNFINSRYAITRLHQFSNCCNERIKQNKICSKCNKIVLTADIRKGIDENTILSKEQEEELKECLESGIMEVVGIREYEKDELINLIPYIQKSQLILPSISKGFKKTDIKTYFSFVNALKELNKICIVKLIQRAVEHLGVLIVYKNDLLFIEIPFKRYNNIEDVLRLKECVNNAVIIEKINNLEEFKEQAKEFINAFESKETKLTEIKEEKTEMLELFIENIKSGNITKKPKKTIKETTKNPFIVVRKK